MNLRIVLGLLVASLTLAWGGAASPAKVDVTYQYTGNPFTIFNPTVGNPYSGTDFVSISLTLAARLPPNLTMFLIEYRVDANFITFDFSDGRHSVVPPIPVLNGTSVLPNVYVSTDAFGNISAPWYLSAFEPDPQQNIFVETIRAEDCPGEESVVGQCGPNNTLPEDLGCTIGSTMCGENLQNPGRWMLVPEPSTLALAAPPLALLGAAAKRRRRRA